MPICRAEGGCSIEYAPEDLADTMCLSCMKLGHLNCKPVTAEKAHPSCANCGGDGHVGTEVPPLQQAPHTPFDKPFSGFLVAEM